MSSGDSRINFHNIRSLKQIVVLDDQIRPIFLLMIYFIQGNLLESSAEALVNAVNTLGVMGKGIALQFKATFPENYKAYRKACEEGKLEPGGIFAFKEDTLLGLRIIFNLATKKEWYRKSTYAWIEAGLQELVHMAGEWKIKSLAVPALGCGNGGLDWNKVKPMIEKHLGNLDGVEVWVYEPSNSVNTGSP